MGAPPLPTTNPASPRAGVLTEQRPEIAPVWFETRRIFLTEWLGDLRPPRVRLVLAAGDRVAGNVTRCGLRSAPANRLSPRYRSAAHASQGGRAAAAAAVVGHPRRLLARQRHPAPAPRRPVAEAQGDRP